MARPVGEEGRESHLGPAIAVPEGVDGIERCEKRCGAIGEVLVAQTAQKLSAVSRPNRAAIWPAMFSG